MTATTSELQARLDEVLESVHDRELEADLLRLRIKNWQSAALLAVAGWVLTAAGIVAWVVS